MPRGGFYLFQANQDAFAEAAARATEEAEAAAAPTALPAPETSGQHRPNSDIYMQRTGPTGPAYPRDGPTGPNKNLDSGIFIKVDKTLPEPNKGP